MLSEIDIAKAECQTRVTRDDSDLRSHMSCAYGDVRNDRSCAADDIMGRQSIVRMGNLDEPAGKENRAEE
jgi:hypothetical protein